MTKMKTCRECGEALRESVQPIIFCGSPCKNAFNNRRLQRGAELYDLFMCIRFDRGKARALGLWTLMCRLGNFYRAEDEERRKGSISWMEPEAVISRKPWLKAVQISGYRC